MLRLDRIVSGGGPSGEGAAAETAVWMAGADPVTTAE
jgi:hypothetical protein